MGYQCLVSENIKRLQSLSLLVCVEISSLGWVYSSGSAKVEVKALGAVTQNCVFCKITCMAAFSLWNTPAQQGKKQWKLYKPPVCAASLDPQTRKKNCLKQLTHLKFIELLFLIYTLRCRWFRYLILSLKENLTIQEKHKESFPTSFNIIFWVELIFFKHAWENTRQKWLKWLFSFSKLSAIHCHYSRTLPQKRKKKPHTIWTNTWSFSNIFIFESAQADFSNRHDWLS